jgi:hypothetical protein
VIWGHRLPGRHLCSDLDRRLASRTPLFRQEWTGIRRPSTRSLGNGDKGQAVPVTRDALSHPIQVRSGEERQTEWDDLRAWGHDREHHLEILRDGPIGRHQGGQARMVSECRAHAISFQMKTSRDPMPSLAPGGRRRFGELAARLPDLLDDLMACEPLGMDGSPLPNLAGVYLFSQGPKALYIGQTRKLRQRMRNHRGATSTHNQASFAFLLARAMIVERDPAFDLDRPRAVLAADPVFAPVFAEARDAVRAMTLRFVKVDDPVLRTLLEVYAAVALDTEHNDFDTH